MRNLARRILKWLGFFLLGASLVVGAVYIYLASTVGERTADRGFFMQEDKLPLVIAHRGGAGLYPENTLYAFEKSWKLGVDVLELDVRETADGALVVMHDAKVDRTTDGSGQISEMPLEALKKLNAAYRFTTDGGQNFPFREQKIAVPTLEEVFAALPEAGFNIEPKHESPTIVKSLCKLIQKYKMTDKTVVGSFSQTNIENFRRECSEVATSAGTSEVSKFLALYKAGLGESYSPAMSALQTPEYVGGLQIISKEFIAAAHGRNLQVHVWTINEPAAMQRLLEIGVDGIMTDYPNRLLNLLGRTKKP